MNGPTYPVMGLSKWKDLACAGKAPTDVTIRKADATGQVKAVAGQDRSLNFTISTNSVDRDMDTIAMDGWDLRAYMRSPIVLWAHDYSELPIAKSTQVTRDFNRLKATAQFPTQDLYPFGATVYDMLREGYLNATSVGFRPLKWDQNEHGGIFFEEAELLEWSVVPVPANPEALIEAQAKGYDPVLLRRCFDGRCGPYIEIRNEEEGTFNVAEVNRMLNGIIREAVEKAVVPAIQDAMTRHTGRVY